MFVFCTHLREPRIIQKPRRMSKAPDGEGCPRCDGHVYAAEQMLARGRVSIIHILYIHLKYLNYNLIINNILCYTGIP